MITFNISTKDLFPYLDEKNKKKSSCQYFPINSTEALVSLELADYKDFNKDMKKLTSNFYNFFNNFYNNPKISLGDQKRDFMPDFKESLEDFIGFLCRNSYFTSKSKELNETKTSEVHSFIEDLHNKKYLDEKEYLLLLIYFEKNVGEDEELGNNLNYESLIKSCERVSNKYKKYNRDLKKLTNEIQKQKDILLKHLSTRFVSLNPYVTVLSSQGFGHHYELSTSKQKKLGEQYLEIYKNDFFGKNITFQRNTKYPNANNLTYEESENNTKLLDEDNLKGLVSYEYLSQITYTGYRTKVTYDLSSSNPSSLLVFNLLKDIRQVLIKLYFYYTHNYKVCNSITFKEYSPLDSYLGKELLKNPDFNLGLVPLNIFSSIFFKNHLYSNYFSRQEIRKLESPGIESKSLVLSRVTNSEYKELIDLYSKVKKVIQDRVEYSLVIDSQKLSYLLGDEDTKKYIEKTVSKDLESKLVYHLAFEISLPELRVSNESLNLGALSKRFEREYETFYSYKELFIYIHSLTHIFDDLDTLFSERGYRRSLESNSLSNSLSNSFTKRELTLLGRYRAMFMPTLHNKFTF